MAITKTDIANRALRAIGAETITAITDGTELANIMNDLYPFCLKSILSECQWGFATKRALMSTSTTTMAWYHTDDGETVVYSKPTDIVRIFDVSDKYAIWREEGDYIISDTANLGIKYVYLLDDPTKYKDSFIEAFIDLLSYQASFKITNSGTSADKLFEKYEKVSLPKAMSENSQVGVQQTIKDDAWLNAKYSNTNQDA